MAKDNIPFHTLIWPAIIFGLNHAIKGLTDSDEVRLPQNGDLALATNVPAMEYLMLAGGQFSKSRKHAVWLPSFLEKFDPDTLRYYLSINMPENHDTDFSWKDFVERVNSELIAAYGNFVHRVMSLTYRISNGEDNPLIEIQSTNAHQFFDFTKLEKIHDDATNSLKKHRYKEALRHIISAAQLGNQMLQSSAPWKHLKSEESSEKNLSLSSLVIGWKICRFLAITTQPFLPFSAQRLWSMLGENGNVSECSWFESTNWDEEIKWNSDEPKPLFQRLDLEKIIEEEKSLADGIIEPKNNDIGHTIKGGKKMKDKEKIEGIKYVDFETFMKVELRVGKITSVEDHPNADKLMIVNVDDGTEKGRTICAGLKEYYSPAEMDGMHVVFVANLEPRKLRGIMSEGMLLAADDGQGNVKLLTLDNSMKPGSRVR